MRRQDTTSERFFTSIKASAKDAACDFKEQLLEFERGLWRDGPAFLDVVFINISGNSKDGWIMVLGYKAIYRDE